MNTVKLSLILSLLISVQANGQLSKNFKQTYLEAEFAYMMEEYSKALVLFEGLLDADPDNHNLHFLCGDCCLKIGIETSRAVKYLEKAIENTNPNYKMNSYKETQAPAVAYLLLARAYHSMHKFDSAITNYEYYRDNTGNKKFSEVEYVHRQIKSCELAMSLMEEPIKVQFRNLRGEFNSKQSTSNPVVSGNDSMLIYIEKYPNQSAVMMSELGETGWTKAHKINAQLGISGNFYPVSLSYDGQELLLIKQDYNDSQIYMSKYKGRGWGTAVELTKNINSRYRETHASLSKDGNLLYFVSDRKGGIGGLDIYCSRKDPEGNWQEPENLGPSVNTIYNEDTPFLTANDKKLYFSSDGHQTMGGYDIFSCTLDQSGAWGAPQNLGYPLNTCYDDLFFNPGWKDNKGYIAWRAEGQSRSQIKNIVILSTGDPGVIISGKPRETQNIADSLSLNEENHADTTNRTTVVISEKVSVAENTGSSMTRGFSYLTLNSILFDFDDHRLNSKAIQEAERIRLVMKDIPEVTITLTGHTDSKGSDSYNRKLSLMRAQSVADYLIDGGVSAQRIRVTGIGETRPIAINKYEDDSDAPKGRLLKSYDRNEPLPGMELQSPAGTSGATG